MPIIYHSLLALQNTHHVVIIIAVREGNYFKLSVTAMA